MKKKQLHKSNRLVTMLLLVMAILMPYGGAWAQTKPSKGEGKVDSPYIITTAEELKWFRDEVNRGKYSICAKISDEVDVMTGPKFRPSIIPKANKKAKAKR